MKITWLRPGMLLRPGLEEASCEIEWTPLIPVSALFGDPKPHDGDAGEGERQWLLDNVYEFVTLPIQQNLYTRQATLLNRYPVKFPRNCLSQFQFMARPYQGKDVLNLFVYVRSAAIQHLGYDLITIDKVYQVAKLQCPIGVDVGLIQVRVESLHYYTEEGHGL